MWSSRLFWKLFLVYVGLNLSLAVGLLFAVTASQRAEINRQVEQHLLDSAILLRSHVQPMLSDYLESPPESDVHQQSQIALQSLLRQLASETDTRLTVVDGNGLVVADSERDPENMLSHANRAELIAAETFGQGTAARPSPTLGTDMYYLALRFESPQGERAYVRAAIHLATINQRVAAVRRYLGLFILLLGVAATGLLYAIVGRIIHPLEQLTQRAQAMTGDLESEPVPVISRDEVGLLATSFNQMQAELTRRFRQLRENNERMATVLGSMQEGVIAIDAQERIVLANGASRSLLSFATDDEVGRPLLAVIRSRTLRDVFQKCLSSGDPVQTEFESPGQPRRALAVRATCLPGTPPHGVVLVLHDITELRRLENLRQDFVANVSHELKTPLASIKAYAETLRMGAIDDPENNLRFVGRIEEQAERLHQLILDLLQIARVESGEQTFEIMPLTVARVVNACLSQYREAAERRHIALEVTTQDESLQVLADEDGLRTILDNLVSNAIKYTPDGGRVTLSWSLSAEWLRLVVQDTGVGIAPIHQTRVFERFYRADKARSRELGGTGLGLSIVKHLCQAFGGSVHLTSQPGEGSTFEIRLPPA